MNEDGGHEQDSGRGAAPRRESGGSHSGEEPSQGGGAARERLAIPIFRDEIAPRFCFARQILLADIAAGEVAARRVVEVSALGWQARLAMLGRESTSWLLCGGFNRAYLPLVQVMGIRVSWGHSGPVMSLLEAWCRGEVERVDRAPLGCGRRRRGPRPVPRDGPGARSSDVPGSSMGRRRGHGRRGGRR